ncbi:AmmeMemoRadiSam system protein B [Flocculibacter collagenilyticus]|uniref:AmmeMemoRadiSam system protein B n=1 Tax=Flocculibacter collagenilyticus TaxID=2744479 RepID=UPI0018F68423|nr:AmmeMemoRadiSam system protein B [Flocculibacter collagenilyticus]
MMKLRPAAVAGMFYPEQTDELAALLAKLLLSAEGNKLTPKALIVPHAGYAYSGQIAAAAYRHLQLTGNHIKNVILMGPAHRYPLVGFALPSHDAFSTPLGNIPINQGIRSNLCQREDVEVNDFAHVMEHSLEVQLPFLQMCLTDFFIVPLLVGKATAEDVFEMCELLPLNKETLFVVSTDLSHFNDYAQAKSADDETITKIATLQTNIQPEQACGAHALNGFLLLCKYARWQPELLIAKNSGDMNGSKHDVVGYASFIVR